MTALLPPTSLAVLLVLASVAGGVALGFHLRGLADIASVARENRALRALRALPPAGTAPMPALPSADLPDVEEWVRAVRAADDIPLHPQSVTAAEVYPALARDREAQAAADRITGPGDTRRILAGPEPKVGRHAAARRIVGAV